MSSIDKLVVAALVEDDRKRKAGMKWKHDKKKAFEERVGVIENSLVSPRAYYYIVSLNDEPVSFEHFKDRDPNVRATQGIYSLTYFPDTDYKQKKGQPYVIGQDLIRWRITCSGYPHWKCLAKRIPELGWIDRNTNISRGLFAIAKQHPGLTLMFTPKLDEYCEMIQKKADELGIDIDHKPLVAYKCSQKDYEEKFKNKQLSEIKQFYHYMKEINEAEKESIEHGE